MKPKHLPSKHGFRKHKWRFQINRTAAVFLALMLSAQPVVSQARNAANDQARFEVAAIRPSGNVPGTRITDPSRIKWARVSLYELLGRAFGIHAYQLSSPEWARSLRFDIAATIEPGATRADLPAMVRNLLIDRFQLVFHREQSEMKGYVLTVSRGGPQLHESTSEPDSLRKAKDSTGVPQVPKSGIVVLGLPDRMRLSARLQTMTTIANWISELLGAPVADGTGMTGTYDFNLDLLRAPSPGPDAAGVPVAAASALSPADIISAVQSQLGLKLEPSGAIIEKVVVDRIAKTPTDN